MSRCDIRRHVGTSPPDLSRLTKEAVVENLLFVSRTVDDWVSGENRFDREGEGFWTAVTGSGETIGMCGINVDPYLDDPMVGRLRHLYVATDHRGEGLGKELVRIAADFGMRRFAMIRLRTPSVTASKFYDHLGFERSGSASATHQIRRSIGQPQ